MTKTETVTVVVYPSGADVDNLTVSDAMQQVLDTFALLGKAEAQRIGSKQIVWRLRASFHKLSFHGLGNRSFSRSIGLNRERGVPS